MKEVVALGAGLVGREVARDLAPHLEVTSADSNGARLQEVASSTPIRARMADLADSATLKRVVESADADRLPLHV